VFTLVWRYCDGLYYNLSEFCKKLLNIKNGAKIRNGDRSRPRQRISRDEAQGARQAFQAKGNPTQARQVRSRDGQGDCRIRSLREALFGVVEGFQGQKMLEVRQEAPWSSRQRKEKARGDASCPPSTEKGRQAINVSIVILKY